MDLVAQRAQQLAVDVVFAVGEVGAGGHHLHGVGAGAIELFQPTQPRQLQNRQPLRSLEPLAKPAC